MNIWVMTAAGEFRSQSSAVSNLAIANKSDSSLTVSHALETVRSDFACYCQTALWLPCKNGATGRLNRATFLDFFAQPFSKSFALIMLLFTSHGGVTFPASRMG